MWRKKKPPKVQWVSWFSSVSFSSDVRRSIKSSQIQLYRQVLRACVAGSLGLLPSVGLSLLCADSSQVWWNTTHTSCHSFQNKGLNANERFERIRKSCVTFFGDLKWIILALYYIITLYIAFKSEPDSVYSNVYLQEALQIALLFGQGNCELLEWAEWQKPETNAFFRPSILYINQAQEVKSCF